MTPPRATRANDTIVAIASPPGAASRGVIRVSGPRARDLANAVWRGEKSLSLGARELALGRFHDGRGTQPVLVVWMQGPRSFTREDVVEFHLPGHPELLRAALARLMELGARLAEPGEFTRRAFHSGRIDLTRAEGVLALVFASNAEEARSARALLFGGLEERIAAARSALLDLRTLVEASLDFDEHDTGVVPARELLEALSKADDALRLAITFETQRVPRSGLARVVLCGAPNAGKSALFNALSGGDALVTAHAGTTRDVLEAHLVLPHATALLFDTAGIEDAVHGPAAHAQELGQRARTAADVNLWVVDGSTAECMSARREREHLSTSPTILVWHKSDLAPRIETWTRELDVVAVLAVSSRSGSGLLELRERLDLELGRQVGGRGREIFERHAQALSEARAELERARVGIRAGSHLELAAEDLRRASSALDRVSGSTTPEDVLDRIFAAFCLGK